MSDAPPTMDYGTPRVRRTMLARRVLALLPGADVFALAFSVVAAGPLVGFYVWMRASGLNGWGAGLAAIPFVGSSTVLSPVALIVSIVIVRRLKMLTTAAVYAVAISLATTVLCVWVWLH
ncbi:MAG TPA: hypothetical protein VGR35_09755 [Tepidisphaeraceae bacterium]|nr:hypothetical protein [Tepidisphaeraceae bacterium]